MIKNNNVHDDQSAIRKELANKLSADLLAVTISLFGFATVAVSFTSDFKNTAGVSAFIFALALLVSSAFWGLIERFYLYRISNSNQKAHSIYLYAQAITFASGLSLLISYTIYLTGFQMGAGL